MCSIYFALTCGLLGYFVCVAPFYWTTFSPMAGVLPVPLVVLSLYTFLRAQFTDPGILLRILVPYLR